MDGRHSCDAGGIGFGLCGGSRNNVRYERGGINDTTLKENTIAACRVLIVTIAPGRISERDKGSVNLEAGVLDEMEEW